MIRTRQIVPCADRRVGANKYRPSVPHSGGHSIPIGGHNLEVLRSQHITHGQCVVHRIDKNHGRLVSRQRCLHAFAVQGGGSSLGHQLNNFLGQCLAGGDENRLGQLVVLGLADQISRHKIRWGRFVSNNRDFGGARLRVDAHLAFEESFCASDKAIAGSRDDGHRLQSHIGDTIGKCRDGACSPHGVHLLHAQKCRGGANHGVNMAVVVVLRW